MSAEKRLTALYLDSSAIVKLVIDEPGSRALRRWIRRRRPLVSSALARTEVVRAVRAQGVEAVRRARRVLTRFALVELDSEILDAAADLEPTTLRSLDAIHLASARALGTDLERLVAYDERLLAAAREHGLVVISPR